MKIGSITEEEVLKLARNAYENGKARFDLVREKAALLVIDMQEPELKVLRKGFAKIMTCEEIINAL